MNEKLPFVPEGVYLIVVNRGNMQSVFPLRPDELKDIQGAHLAATAARTFAQLQSQYAADRPSKPIDPKSHTQLALQYLNGEYLRADVSLASQFEGRWETVEVPEQLRNKYTGRAPYIELNLVDTPIILVR